MNAIELNELKLHLRMLNEKRKTVVLSLKILAELAKHDLRLHELRKKYPNTLGKPS